MRWGRGWLTLRHKILLMLVKLYVNQLYQSFDESKRENSVKFLRVAIDENLRWKNHIEVVENKISKNIGVLYRTSHLLDFKNLLKIYFSFIYISYANIARGTHFFL